LLAAAFLVLIGVNSDVSPLRADWLRLTSARADPIAEQDREYRALVPSLPRNGRIGYRQPPDWPSVDATRKFYLAEYALTPRIVVMDTGPEFVIANPDSRTDADKRAATRDGSDPQLAGFALYWKTDGGPEIFRRVR
jgi:hypothetical protein